MTRLADRIALVTGAGRGIGRGCAIELARDGADVVLNDRPGSADLAAAADEIRSFGGKCEIAAADVFCRSGCEELVHRAAAAFGRIDILVSNPALGHRSPFLEYDPATFERVVQATLVAGFHASQLVARHMVARGGRGKIVFISSVHALSPYGGCAAYNAAKAGLNHLAASIALELAPHRINVNTIEPGWIDTPGERQTFGEDYLRAGAAKLPWGRLGTPEDIGRAAAFLASDDADYITGAVLRVDGGFWFKDDR
ncbi:MAG: SDR family oxidoreductase [Planctomycetia bacterium]|nr:SDR family oxidoreductase [Planctomycetia bacterium]